MSWILVSKKWSAVSKAMNMAFIVASAFFAMTEVQAAVSHVHGFYSETTGAQNGFCVRPPSGTPVEVLKRNGVRVRGATKPGDLYALAKGINQVERLLGHPLPTSWRTKVRYVDSYGSWNQGLEGDGNEINVHRPLRGSRVIFDGSDVSAYMHEFGHAVGNADSGRVYRDFRRNVAPCIGYTEHGERTSTISHYAGTKFNEQFAEVFMVYVVNPQDLKKRCPQAYNYFSKRLFAKNSARAEARCGGDTAEKPQPRKNKPKDSTRGEPVKPRLDHNSDVNDYSDGLL